MVKRRIKPKHLTLARLREEHRKHGGNFPPGVSLYCPRCGDTWSATPEDYFRVPDDHVFLCSNDDCFDEPLILAQRIARIRKLAP
jgi:hypothetical protein